MALRKTCIALSINLVMATGPGSGVDELEEIQEIQIDRSMLKSWAEVWKPLHAAAGENPLNAYCWVGWIESVVPIGALSTQQKFDLVFLHLRSVFDATTEAYHGNLKETESVATASDKLCSEHFKVGDAGGPYSPADVVAIILGERTWPENIKRPMDSGEPSLHDCICWTLAWDIICRAILHWSDGNSFDSIPDSSVYEIGDDIHKCRLVPIEWLASALYNCDGECLAAALLEGAEVGEGSTSDARRLLEKQGEREQAVATFQKELVDSLGEFDDTKHLTTKEKENFGVYASEAVRSTEAGYAEAAARNETRVYPRPVGEPAQSQLSLSGGDTAISVTGNDPLQGLAVAFKDTQEGFVKLTNGEIDLPTGDEEAITADSLQTKLLESEAAGQRLQGEDAGKDPDRAEESGEMPFAHFLEAVRLAASEIKNEMVDQIVGVVNKVKANAPVSFQKYKDALSKLRAKASTNGATAVEDLLDDARSLESKLLHMTDNDNISTEKLAAFPDGITKAQLAVTELQNMMGTQP